MNSAIITSHGAHNYGAVLQAYSLQTYIKNNVDQDVIIINFIKDGYYKSHKLLKRPTGIKGYLLESLSLIHYKSIKKRHDAFISFIDQFLNLTAPYYTFNELKLNPPIADNYIVGSDQVFNPLRSDKNVYFLEFCPESKKKIAYAPSFGYSWIPDEYKESIANYLNKFDYLSAREICGCRIIKELSGRDVPNLLDPVFLPNVETFIDIEKPVKIGFSNYILCYGLSDFKKQLKLAKKIKQLTKLPIVLITSDPRPLWEVDKVVRHAGPREFLWLVNNSNYVVTDSFHGTVFSLVFKKPFFAFIALQEKKDRIISILDNLDLIDRIVESPDEINDNNLVFDYKIVVDKLGILKDISKKYLVEAIGGEL